VLARDSTSLSSSFCATSTSFFVGAGLPWQKMSGGEEAKGDGEEHPKHAATMHLSGRGVPSLGGEEQGALEELTSRTTSSSHLHVLLPPPRPLTSCTTSFTPAALPASPSRKQTVIVAPTPVFGWA
jgi:hypothetical protein